MLRSTDFSQASEAEVSCAWLVLFAGRVGRVGRVSLRLCMSDVLPPVNASSWAYVDTDLRASITRWLLLPFVFGPGSHARTYLSLYSVHNPVRTSVAKDSRLEYSSSLVSPGALRHSSEFVLPCQRQGQRVPVCSGSHWQALPLEPGINDISASQFIFKYVVEFSH